MTSELRQAFDPVADALDALGVEFRISGSVASSALGVARSTLDGDVVADLQASHVEGLVARLEDSYYVDGPSIEDAIRAHRSFNVIHLATMVKIDVFVLRTRSIDQASFARVTRESIGGDADREFPITTAEDLILRELEWYERGDRVSERQRSGVLRVQAGALDIDYMRYWAGELGLSDLIESALDESGSDA